jgi:plasmid stabilization system protein ParE
MDEALHKNVSEEVRQLRDEVAELRASFDALRQHSEIGNRFSLIDTALLRLRCQPRKLSVFYLLDEDTLRELSRRLLSRRLLTDSAVAAHRWLHETTDAAISYRAIARFGLRLHRAIADLQPRAPVGARHA